MPSAEGVGGIAGKLATASSVKASAFDGIIDGAKMVGGIVAVAGSGENISHVHVNATLSGSEQLGGIIGYSERAPMTNCYAEGALILKDNAIVAKVGGMIGEMQVDEVGEGPIVIANCLVGIEAITLPQNLDSLYVHRVIGFSGSDKYNYFEQKYEDPETKIKDCSDLAAIDTNIALTDTTTEGATLAWSDVNVEWLNAQGFVQGDSIGAPWLYENDALRLWYEIEVSDDVENIWGEDTNSNMPNTKKIIINGRLIIIRNGEIYDVTGVRIN